MSKDETYIASKDGQGGFMAVLHSLEEQFYGPETNDLTGSAMKVLLYIRHRVLRDWTNRKQIPKVEIMKATGLEKRCLERTLRELEKKEFLLVTRTKVGKVWSDNAYELHPKRYGNDYVYRPEKPSFKVIYGSKGHKSNPKNLSTEDSELSTNTKIDGGVPVDTTVETVSDTTAGVPSRQPVGNTLNHTELLENNASKNPLKEPIKRTLSENFNFSEEQRKAEEAKQLIKKLCNLKNIPK